MEFNNLIPISLVCLLLILVYSLAGVTVRKRPALLFFLGFCTAIAGVFLWEMTILYATSFDKFCHLALTEKQCFLNSHLNELVSKVVEVGFAALGAGLMALAIDVKTDAMATANDKRLFQRLEQLKHKIFLWHRASKKLGEELDALDGKERVRRFKALQEILLNIDDKEDELRNDFEKWNLDFPDKDVT